MQHADQRNAIGDGPVEDEIVAYGKAAQIGRKIRFRPSDAGHSREAGKLPLDGGNRPVGGGGFSRAM